MTTHHKVWKLLVVSGSREKQLSVDAQAIYRSVSNSEIKMALLILI